MDITQSDKRLAWAGLIVGGGASVFGNIRSVWLPEIPITDVLSSDKLSAWRALPLESHVTGWPIFWSVLFPLIALWAVEMLGRFAHLKPIIRYGLTSLIAAVAVFISYAHLATVLMWEGNPPLISLLAPAAIDGAMIFSTVALLSKVPEVSTVQPDTDNGQPDIEQVADSADNGQPDIEQVADSADMDKAPDTVPDMDNLPDAPADIIPTQRRPRADKAWMSAAADMIRNGDPDTDKGIAEKILADAPDTWTGIDPVEAGRVAVRRLRKRL